MSKDICIDVYVLRNGDHEFFRSKGYGGYGKSWVKDIKDAKMYPKLGSARRQVTWWSNNFPEYGIPNILRLEAKIAEVIDDSDRVNKSKDAKAKREREYEIRQKERDLASAQAALERAKAKVKAMESS